MSQFAGEVNAGHIDPRCGCENCCKTFNLSKYRMSDGLLMWRKFVGNCDHINPATFQQMIVLVPRGDDELVCGIGSFTFGNGMSDVIGISLDGRQQWGIEVFGDVATPQEHTRRWLIDTNAAREIIIRHAYTVGLSNLPTITKLNADLTVAWRVHSVAGQALLFSGDSILAAASEESPVFKYSAADGSLQATYFSGFTCGLLGKLNDGSDSIYLSRSDGVTGEIVTADGSGELAAVTGISAQLRIMKVDDDRVVVWTATDPPGTQFEIRPDGLGAPTLTIDWTADPLNGVFDVAASADGIVGVNSAGGVYCYNWDGTLRWYHYMNAWATVCQIVGDYLYVGSTLGTLTQCNAGCLPPRFLWVDLPDDLELDFGSGLKPVTGPLGEQYQALHRLNEIPHGTVDHCVFLPESGDNRIVKHPFDVSPDDGKCHLELRLHIGTGSGSPAGTNGTAMASYVCNRAFGTYEHESDDGAAEGWPATIDVSCVSEVPTN